MVPADERLDARNAVVAGVDDRLVEKVYLSLRERVTQILLQHPSVRRGLEEIAGKEAEAPPAARLRGIEREIDVADQFLAGGTIARRHGHADGGTDDAAAATHRIGLGQAGDDAVREIPHPATIIETRQDDLELVAPEAENLLPVADDLEEPFADLLQQRVTRRVAERVIDLLEAIEIDEEDGAWPPPVPERDQARLERARHAETVGQTGQRIVHRKLRGLLRRSALLGDINAGPTIAGEIARVIKLGRAGHQPPPIVFPARGTQGELLEARPPGHDERQRPADLGAFVAPDEMISKRGPDHIFGIEPQSRGEGLRQIGQTTRAVGCPEPALAGPFEILEKQQRISCQAMRMRRDRFAACRLRREIGCRVLISCDPRTSDLGLFLEQANLDHFSSARRLPCRGRS